MSKSQPLTVAHSQQFPEWLHEQQISLAFTTYQTNRLFLIGLHPDGRLSAVDREFDRPMGLFATPERLVMSTHYQIWQFDNLCRPEVGVRDYLEYDKLYVPRVGYTTGDINTHDVIVDRSDNWVFVNTQFSCLATRDRDCSFRPIWQPPFISSLAAEDRCHLNGLAMVDGEPAYVSACSQTDSPTGWRQQRQEGGCIINIRSNEIVCRGLTMPHSPRVYQEKLWILNSGTGEFGYVESGHFHPVSFCPGFVRGLAFYRNFALVGLSKPRHHNFHGLALDDRLSNQGQQAQCGLMVIDLNSGQIVHKLLFETIVTELYDLAVLPGVRQPMALGFHTDDIERLVTFPGSGRIVSTRPGIHQVPEIQVKVIESEEPRTTAPRERPPLETAVAQFDRGRQLQKQGKFKEAIACFREAIALNSHYTAAYNNLGNLLQSQGKTQEAIACYEKALELNPSLAPAHCNLGSARQMQGEIEAAIASYREALRLKPDFVQAHHNLAQLLEAVKAADKTADNTEVKTAIAPPSATPAAPTATAPVSHPLPKVSLMMTAYNTAAYIEEAIASVLAQTYQDWELIIWDDGSKDETPSIARAYAERDPRIRFYGKPHRGYSPALISSFNLARGDYFGCVDSDDILAPTALEETVAILDSDSDLGVVYTDHIDIDASGNEIGLNYRASIPYSPERLLRDFIIFHFRLIRRQVFEAVGGFNLEFQSAPDYDLCLRLSEMTQFYHLAKPLYFYRQRPQQITQSRSVKYQAVYNLTPDNLAPYDAFTFPSLQKRWQTQRQRGELIGISATIDNRMVGMVIAEIIPDSQNPATTYASILSCFVVPDAQQQGIGTTLINHLEKELRKIGCQQIEMTYKSSELTTLALEPLLQKLGWLPPKTTFILAQTTTEKIAEAPWLYKYPLPDSFTVFPWVELTAKDRQTLLQKGGYPPSLNPFLDEARLEPMNSLGLRHQGEAIGWIVTHRVAPDTIRYSSLFVDAKYQKLGRGISLLSQSIQRQIASEIENYTFSVAWENQPMIKFLERHLRPYLTGMGSSRKTVKPLTP